MIYQTYIPRFPLNQFVEQFVYYRDYITHHDVDRFMPDGYAHIVFDLTDYPKYIFDNDSLKEIQSCKQVWFSGIREKFITIPSGRDTEMLIVYFKKGCAYPFVDIPMHEYTDYVVDAQDVLSNAILHLREQLLSCTTIAAKFACAENYFTGTYASRMILNPFVDFAVKQIVANPNHLTIQQLSEKVGYSQKHMISLFKSHVGVTPKAFLKIMRFQLAVQEIAKGKAGNWTDVAHAAGYFDQAHFIHDFKAFSGFTPNQYAQQQGDFVNYIPMG